MQSQGGRCPLRGQQTQISRSVQNSSSPKCVLKWSVVNPRKIKLHGASSKSSKTHQSSSRRIRAHQNAPGHCNMHKEHQWSSKRVGIWSFAPSFAPIFWDSLTARSPIKHATKRIEFHQDASNNVSDSKTQSHNSEMDICWRPQRSRSWQIGKDHRGHRTHRGHGHRIH